MVEHFNNAIHFVKILEHLIMLSIDMQFMPDE